MGGMGGGMGGMGGGMGGMRSVPPTGNPHAILQPNQTRSLPTRLVSLTGPNPEAKVTFPSKGEKLELGDEKGNFFTLPDGQEFKLDPRTRAALKRLAEDKAPTTISQLVLWNISAGRDWATIAQASRGWANAHEVTLARQFVTTLDAPAEGESGRIYLEVKGSPALAAEIAGLFKGNSMLGLKVESGVPSRPQGPAVACTIEVAGETAKVVVRASNDRGQAWVDGGKFDATIALKDGKPDALALADSVAAGVLGRLVDVKLIKGKKVKGKDTYTVRIDNYSPLILNGLSLSGAGDKSSDAAKMLAGICLSPRKSLTVPASAEAVEGLGLKQGVRVLAADLSGL